MIIKKSGILIPKDYPKFKDIVKDLKRNIYGWNGDVANVEFYEEFGNFILIPRFYPISEEIMDMSDIGADINIESNIIPRNNRQKKSIQFLMENYNGILQLEPGSGKTIIAIDAICKIKKRAIIIAHKDKLLDNWKSEFLAHTNIKEEEIIRLSSSNFQKAFEKPIILATPHTIAYAVTHEKDQFVSCLLNSNIGIAFIDECHVGVGPEKFSKASLHLNCKRVFGLSATPNRSDGNDDIIQYHLGEVTYYPPEEDELLIPKIFMIYFDFGIYSRHKKYLEWGGRFNPSRYLKQMKKSRKYIEIVSKLIFRAYKEGNRNILVLGNHSDCLLELARETGIEPNDVGIFIPATSKKDRLSVSDTDDLDIAFHQKRVVFATYLGARDGNNRKNLDCLVMSTTTGNLKQAVGRIQRELEGKNQPIVIDIIDTDGPLVKSVLNPAEKIKWFINSSIKREIEYKKLGWDIQKIYLDGDPS